MPDFVPGGEIFRLSLLRRPFAATTHPIELYLVAEKVEDVAIVQPATDYQGGAVNDNGKVR